jgi:hypothetical protein
MLLLYQLKRGYSDDLLANLNDAGLNSFEVGRIECVYNREDRLAGYAVFIPDYVEGKTTYHRVFVPYRFIRTDQRDYGTPPPPNEVYVTLQRDANKPDVVGILYGVN